MAVLDTGLDTAHPDLPDTVAYVHDYPSSGASVSTDIVGHGTHVAGTIGAVINNDMGVNGICDCALSAYKIFGDTPMYLPPPLNYFAYVVDPILYPTTARAG